MSSKSSLRSSFDAEDPNEEIPLSEVAELYAEKELLPPASKEDLKLDFEDISPMFKIARRQTP